MKLGLIASPQLDLAAVARLVDRGAVSSVWARDLPVVPGEDPDRGQGSDPWWHLGRLWGQGIRPSHLGTASIILGLRHPWVVARAAAGAQTDTGGRFVLGVGSSGKPRATTALGLTDQGLVGFAAAWLELRQAVHTAAASSANGIPADPAPMYLATRDVDRWRAIDGEADGWQTFLTDNRREFDRRYRHIAEICGRQVPVDVRVDAHIVSSGSAAPQPTFTQPDRGRVRCTPDQLATLLTAWATPPVDRILLHVTGSQPELTITHLADALPAGTLR